MIRTSARKWKQRLIRYSKNCCLKSQKCGRDPDYVSQWTGSVNPKPYAK